MPSSKFIFVADEDGLKKLSKSGELISSVEKYGRCTAISVDTDNNIYGCFVRDENPKLRKFDENLNLLWTNLNIRNPIRYIKIVSSTDTLYYSTIEKDLRAFVGRVGTDGVFYGDVEIPDNSSGLTWYKGSSIFVATDTKENFNFNLHRYTEDGLLEDRWDADSSVSDDLDTLKGVSAVPNDGTLITHRADETLAKYKVPQEDESLKLVTETTNSESNTDTKDPRSDVTTDYYYHIRGSSDTSLQRVPTTDITSVDYEVDLGYGIGGVSVSPDEQAFVYTDDSVNGGEKIFKVEPDGTYTEIAVVGNTCNDIAVYEKYDTSPYEWRDNDTFEDFRNTVIAGYSNNVAELDDSLNEKWNNVVSNPTDVTYNSSGVVYATSYEGAVVAINSDGTVLWKWESGESDYPFNGRPDSIVHKKEEKKLYVLDSNGPRYAELSSEDGSIISINSGGSGSTSRDLDVDTNGNVYIANRGSFVGDGGYLNKFNSDGEHQWYDRTLPSRTYSIDIDDDDNIITAGFGGDGKPSWVHYKPDQTVVNTGPEDIDAVSVSTFESGKSWENADVESGTARFALATGGFEGPVDISTRDTGEVAEIYKGSGDINDLYDVFVEIKNPDGSTKILQEAATDVTDEGLAKISVFPSLSTNESVWGAELSVSQKSSTTAVNTAAFVSEPTESESSLYSVVADVFPVETLLESTTLSVTISPSTKVLIGETDLQADTVSSLSAASTTGVVATSTGNSETSALVSEPSVFTAVSEGISSSDTITTPIFQPVEVTANSLKEILSTGSKELSVATTTDTLAETGLTQNSVVVTGTTTASITNELSQSFLQSDSITSFVTIRQANSIGGAMTSGTPVVIPENPTVTSGFGTSEIATILQNVAVQTTALALPGEIQPSALFVVDASLVQISERLDIEVGSVENSPSVSVVGSETTPENIAGVTLATVDSLPLVTQSSRENIFEPTEKEVDSEIVSVASKTAENFVVERRVQSYGHYNDFEDST